VSIGDTNVGRGIFVGGVFVCCVWVYVFCLYVGGECVTPLIGIGNIYLVLV
jgi:hypothetical protein